MNLHAFLLKVDHAVREKFRTYVVVILGEKEKQSQNAERAVCSVFRTHVAALLEKNEKKSQNAERAVCSVFRTHVVCCFNGKK